MRIFSAAASVLMLHRRSWPAFCSNLRTSVPKYQIILDQDPSLSLSEQALVLPFSTPEEMLADHQNAVSEDFAFFQVSHTK